MDSRVTRPRKRPRTSAHPIAVTGMKVVRLATDPDVSVADLGAMVTADPALSLRVLALVNSAAFMPGRNVSDVRHAVGLLGANGLRNLALGLVVSDMAPASDGGNLMLANSVRRALAAQSIGTALGHRQADEYFTAGLLLDIGLLDACREDFDWATSVAQRPAAHRAVIERASGRGPHTARGALLAQEYGLPGAMLDAIASHHDETPPEGDLPKACWLAERFAGVFEGGDLVATKAKALEAATSIGLDAHKAEAILQELPELVAESAEAFDRDLGEQMSLDALLEHANQSLVALNNHYELLVRQLQSLIEEKEVLERQLKDANEQLAKEATTDPLTGLPNKRALKRALERDLASAGRSGDPVSILVVDIDHFKRFNDEFGHSTGDEVLECVGTLLGRCTRGGDYPARFGGEEFVVVLPSTDIAGARLAGERVRKAIEIMRHPDPAVPNITASIGIATIRGSDCASRAQELFDAADAALYAAKAGGRNRVGAPRPTAEIRRVS